MPLSPFCRHALMLLLTAISAPALASNAVAPPVEIEEAQPLFLPAADGSPGIPIDVASPFTRSAWVVTTNVAGIARHTERIVVQPVGGAPALEFARSRFEPRAGFSLDDDGNLIIDEDPRKLSYFWYGRDGRNHLFLTVHEGNVHAMVHGPLLRLGIRPEHPGMVLRELDAAAVDAGGCATDLPRNTPIPVGVVGSAATSTAATTKPPLVVTQPLTSPIHAPKHTARIGLMLYYTDAALAEFPNNDPNNPPLQQLQTVATGLVDELNQALINSGDTYYVRFTQIGGLVNLSGYNESPQIADGNARFVDGHLVALRNYDRSASDPTRATVGADFALLLVKDEGNPNATPIPRPVWGAAFTQRHNCFGDQQCDVGDGEYPIATFSYRNYAYGAVSVSPNAQNLTFAHEIGHMLGSNHDPNVQFPIGGLRAAFGFSYGYRVPLVARDIMSDPRCVDTTGDGIGDQCTERVPQFANPRVDFFGTPAVSGLATRDVVRTVSCLAEPSGNLYPLSDAQSAPNLFWGGFEAPGTFIINCPTRLLW